jgi:mannosyl-oligosaccharide alpha-1,2-mannosidase
MQEHLATFAGGMLAVGSVNLNSHSEEELALAEKLAETCALLYREFPLGIAPDQVMFNTNIPENTSDYEAGHTKEYILRPESAETVYTLWKFTGLQKYRDWAWEMFQAINRSCRVPGGFAAIFDVTDTNVTYLDQMESFFLAETLKYFYLTFSDSDLLSPAEWVFNTEAHPVRHWDSKTVRKFRHLLQFEPPSQSSLFT